MAPRVELQALLEQVLGSSNVYFQPPANVQMQFPCIVYQLDDMDSEFAGNLPYRIERRYQITAIDRNPDSEIRDRIVVLPLCTFVRSFKAENLNHDVFNLYF